MVHSAFCHIRPELLRNILPGFFWSLSALGGSSAIYSRGTPGFLSWLIVLIYIYIRIYKHTVYIYIYIILILLMNEILHQLICILTIIYSVLYIPGGAGFQPSTVSLAAAWGCILFTNFFDPSSIVSLQR